MNNSEFLGVDIGNNGAYRRLQNWSGQHADGEWHLETFTLSGDQISDSFTLRFFGIAQNRLHHLCHRQRHDCCDPRIGCRYPYYTRTDTRP